MNRRFILEGLECSCSIGIYDHERAAEQRVIIDAELELPIASEPRSDKVEDALDYDRIRDTVKAIVSAQHFDLQETLARTLFDALAELPGVAGVRLRTAKPDAYDDCKTIAYELSNLK